MNKKRKDKALLEREALGDSKEIKNMMNEAKLIYEKSKTSAETNQAAELLTKAILKLTSTSTTLHLNHLYHLRGLCHFKLQ